MTDHVLVINAGSSSVKFAIYPVDGDWRHRYLFRGELEGLGHAPRFRVVAPDGQALADEALRLDGTPFGRRQALEFLLDWLKANFRRQSIVAAGHRVVHGGERYAAPVRVDDEVLAYLQGLIPLARLHEPFELAAIRALAQIQPDILQVACFDTGFHHTQPAVARAYGLPRALAAEGVRRYGFHGLSYEYVAHVLPEHIGERARGRVVVAHLGNGASMCGMRNLQSVATTMGFTALEGLLMGTRSGSLDPGVLLYLIQEKQMSPQQVSDLLYFESGLLGVSGISQDMRTLLASGHPHAREAVDLFVYRVSRELGSLAAAIGGLDALVFTGGIGQHAAQVRERVCRDAAWLGVKLDPGANAAAAGRISAADSPAAVCIIPCNEELIIARHTCRLLQQQGLIKRERVAGRQHERAGQA